MINLRQYPGYRGVHSRDQAEGAIPNGTQVRKVKTEDGDRRPIGSLGTVLGSLYYRPIGYGYFVEWNDKPRTAVFVIDWKISRDH